VTLSRGTRLGPYEIFGALGAGGMGVYKAKDTRLERDVAVKVLPAHMSASPEVRQRFEREAKTELRFKILETGDARNIPGTAGALDPLPSRSSLPVDGKCS
jgi:serine/threonine protein kinase